MSTPRLRRLQSDYDNVIKEFVGHPYITVDFEETIPPEIYYVTYRVKGLYLQGGNPVERNVHKVVFYLGKDYPKLKPKCEIKTPIFHPNFRDGVVCIGDHWSAGGETMIDLIVKVGDLIQYRDYNLKSPMDAKAATWANENEHIFPISNFELYRSELQVLLETAEREDDDWSIEFINNDGQSTAGDDLDFEIELIKE